MSLDRRTFSKQAVFIGINLLALLGISGCSSNSKETYYEVTVSNTYIRTGGDAVLWVFEGYIDLDGAANNLDLKLNLSLIHDDGEEIASNSKIINVQYYGLSDEKQIAYAGDAEVINNVVDYELDIEKV